MAKKAILEVLESTIGRYVHNLDAESLNVAVWSGKIELHSLQLDIHAVNSELSRRAQLAPNLACPFRVIEGKFDKVQLDVPWARLTSRPVVFRASGLRVHVEPHDFLAEAKNGNNNGGYTANRYGTKIKSRKANNSHIRQPRDVMEERLRAIATAEEGRRRMSAMRNFALGEGGGHDNGNDESEDHDTNSSATKSSSGGNTFTSRLVRRIIENLQVEIQDVHIAIRGCQTAAGIVLGSLSLSTTDAKGNKTFVDRSAATTTSTSSSATNPLEQVASSFLYKELLISGLGIYLQRDEDSYDTTTTTTSSSSSTQPMARRVLFSNNMEYILEPLSFQAKLRQSDLDTCIDFPKYLVHSKLSSLSITISRNQLELGHRLGMAVVASQQFETAEGKVRPLFPEYRPLVPIKGNAHKWWKYAVRCIGRLNRHRSWIEFYLAFQKRKRYLELYKRSVYAVGGGEQRDNSNTRGGMVVMVTWAITFRK